MARKPTVRVRKGYWVSYAGGKTTYFGRVSETPRKDALKRFKGRSDEEPETPTFTVADLAGRFLEWLKMNRSEKTHEERSRHVRRFVDAHGGVQAKTVDGSFLEAFTASLRQSRHAPDYIHKHVVSIGAMFRFGARKGLIANGTPFASVEPIRRQLRPLTESELMTPSEASTLLAFADADLSTVGTGRGSRRREPHEYRLGEANPWRGFGDLLRTFHATGARTSELLNATVGDFQRSTRAIVLGSHKRAHTMRDARPRTITLNDDAYAIVARRCEGHPRDARIFTQPRNGRPWDRFSVAERFRAIRERAGVRDTITIYSFRHLWISEMLMAGVDVLLVARMAGTSVAMIERVYGHFRNQSYHEAQARLDRERVARGL
jgi:integrase